MATATESVIHRISATLVGRREKILDRPDTYNNVQNGGVDHVELVDNAAMPNNLTYQVDGASPNPKMHEVLAPEGEVVDLNKPIDLSTLPTWREQLTFRALFLGTILGGVFCIITHKLALTIGVIPSLNIAAGLLGFVFVKAWVAAGTKLGLKMQPFTAQENTVIQTTTVSCYGIAFYGGFATYLFSMTPTIQQILGDNPGNSPTDVVNYSTPKTIGYMFLIGFTGIFAVTALRKIFIIDYKLAYPSGTATGVLINSLHTPAGAKRAMKQVKSLGKWFTASFLFSFFKWFFSYAPDGAGCSGGFSSFPTLGIKALNNTWNFDFTQTYVGAGMICPLIVDWSIMLGCIACYGCLIPLVEDRAGAWYPAKYKSGSNLRGVYGYKVFVAIALFLGDGLYNLVKIIILSTRNMLAQRRAKKSGLPVTAKAASFVGSNLVETPQELEARTTWFVTQRIPHWVWITGYIVFAVLAIGLVPQVFPPVKWYFVLIIELLAPAFAVCNAYGAGLTDWNVASTYAKICIFVFAAWAGSNGGVVAGLGSAGVMFGAVGAASDLMQDFRTGYLTLASPKAMFAAQLVGMFGGCFLSPATFQMFVAGQPDLGQPGSTYPAPFAQVYRNMAVVGVGGASELGDNCLWICLAVFLGAIAISLFRDLVPNRIGKFTPLPMAMAVPFLIGGYLGIDMLLGGVIVYIWQKVDRYSADTYAIVAASGMIVGDGIWTIPSSILAVADAQPKICMQFLTQQAADAAAAAAEAAA